MSLTFHICHIIFTVRAICSWPLSLLFASNIPSHLLTKLLLMSFKPSHWIGAILQGSSAFLQKKSICSIVSTSSPQQSQISFLVPDLLCICSLTGRLFSRHLHTKCLSLCFSSNDHRLFHIFDPRWG